MIGIGIFTCGFSLFGGIILRTLQTIVFYVLLPLKNYLVSEIGRLISATLPLINGAVVPAEGLDSVVVPETFPMRKRSGAIPVAGLQCQLKGVK